MKRTGWAALLLVALPAAPATAAPPQLLNKTVMVSFAATGTSRGPDGIAKPFNTQVTRIVYVSSAGRLFLRHRISNTRHSRGRDFGPDEVAGNASFQGNRLVIVQPFQTGARQMIATFDPSYSSCTLNVIEGHAGGVIRRKGPNGAVYEVTGGTAVAPSCSIRDGNAFAG